MSKIVEKNVLNFIKTKKITRTKEIEKKFNLSQSSTRRALINLEKQGLIDRAFGEVILKETNEFKDKKFDEKLNSNVLEKKEIAKIASLLASNYQTIFVDSGSCCYFLLEYLDKNIQLFSNSLSNVVRANELNFKNINILGGHLKPDTKSIIEFNENEINNIVFPISFLGVNAIDENGNLYTPEKKEAIAKREIIKRSLISIVLAENYKFEKISTFKFNPPESKIIIVTNTNVKNIKNKNIQIINVKKYKKEKK